MLINLLPLLLIIIITLSSCGEIETSANVTETDGPIYNALTSDEAISLIPDSSLKQCLMDTISDLYAKDVKVI